MKRRSFIKTFTLTGVALAGAPYMVIAQNTIPINELIGKGKPRLLGKDFLLRPEAYLAFQTMAEAALKEGINIQVVSSYRNFEHQKHIWERKYKRYRNLGFSEKKAIQKIIEYSTIPGTSRHHWGTDIDIIDANVIAPKHVLKAEHFHKNGAFINLKQWMDKYAAHFGFHLVYTNTTNRKGFKYEPWHYSYKPLSKSYLKHYKNIDLKTVLQKEKFAGSSYFSETFIDQYLLENILDINPELL